jgi:hypothetical protein
MKIIADEFPLVRMDYTIEPEATMEVFLGSISALFQRNAPFVFICTGLPEENNQPSLDEHKMVTRWMKDNKEAIGALIKGHIQIVPDASKRAELEGFSLTFERFWGYPMFIAIGESDAIKKAKALLNSGI